MKKFDYPMVIRTENGEVVDATLKHFFADEMQMCGLADNADLYDLEGEMLNQTGAWTIRDTIRAEQFKVYGIEFCFGKIQVYCDMTYDQSEVFNYVKDFTTVSADDKCADPKSEEEHKFNALLDNMLSKSEEELYAMNLDEWWQFWLTYDLFV